MFFMREGGLYSEKATILEVVVVSVGMINTETNAATKLAGR